jgi:hypothetical protein
MPFHGHDDLGFADKTNEGAPADPVQTQPSRGERPDLGADSGLMAAQSSKKSTTPTKRRASAQDGSLQAPSASQRASAKAKSGVPLKAKSPGSRSPKQENL